MNNTITLPRQCVRPGMLVHYDGKLWRASANVGGRLHLTGPDGQTSTTDDEITVWPEGNARAAGRQI